jgi:hypothetical protein
MWWNVGLTLMLQLKRWHPPAWRPGASGGATFGQPEPNRPGARHGAGRPAISYLWLPNTVKSVVTRTPHGSAARLERTPSSRHDFGRS